MKNRDMIEAFEAALGELPVPDQEERRQLFIEKLEELDRARGSGAEPENGGPLPQNRGQKPGGGQRLAQNQPAPGRPAFPMQIIMIALAIAAVVEAVAIGVLLIHGGKKTDPESPSPPLSEVVTSPGTDSLPSESPSEPVSSGTPAQQPSPSPSAASPSPSVSGSAGPQDTGEPPAQSGGEESADPGAVPSYETGDATGTGDGSAPSDATGTGDGTAPSDATGTGDGAAPSDGTGTGDGTAPSDGTAPAGGAGTETGNNP